jgi:hypothetical protein
MSEQAAFGVNVTSGLIHEWRMDETSGSTIYDSAGSWNLQAINGAVTGAAGKSGAGVFLDGANDYLVSSAQNASFLSSDFTLSLWVKWSGVSGKPGVLQFGAGSAGVDFAIDLSYSSPTPSVFANTGSMRVSSSSSIGDGQWHLLSFVRQGSTGSFYLDSTLVGTGSGSLSYSGSLDVFQLGKYDSHMFGGTLDDVAIYDRALSPSEIAANVVPEPGSLSFLLLGSLLTARALVAFKNSPQPPEKSAQP